MIEGITILNTTVVEGGVDIGALVIAGFATLFIGFIFGLAMWDGDPLPAFLCALIGTAVCVTLIVCLDNSPDVTQYEVTISEEVNLKEFNEKYEIIEQRGELYIIQEKAEESE